MHAKITRSRVIAALLLLALLVGGTAHAQAADCGGVSRPIVFAEVDWDSVQVNNAIARTILELGFGCATEAIPGATTPLLQGAIRGDVDVTMEVWLDNSGDIWDPAVAAGTVEQLDVIFDDAVQAWYVPRYVVEGDPERGIEPMAPDLRSVSDLPRYAELFRDPEQPELGRFHNCPIGWQCELINTGKLHAYGLTDDFTDFRPGTGVALASSMEGAYLRGDPWLGYYWAPTWPLGKFDMLRLEEPPYDEARWDQMVAAMEAGEPASVEEACAYPTSTVVVGLGSRFKDEVSPEIKAFLNAMEMPSDRMSELLAFMQNTDSGPMEAAQTFLSEQPEVWSAWVDDETAARVRAGLE